MAYKWGLLTGRIQVCVKVEPPLDIQANTDGLRLGMTGPQQTDQSNYQTLGGFSPGCLGEDTLRNLRISAPSGFWGNYTMCPSHVCIGSSKIHDIMGSYVSFIFLGY